MFITPSRPTIPRVLETISVTIQSLLLAMRHTASNSRLEVTGLVISVRNCKTTRSPRSRPFFRAIGCAFQNYIDFQPRVKISRVSTAVEVVPSPAKLLVAPAALLRSLDPISCARESKCTDLTTVTPSLVILGSPPSYSSATFRPPGPSVSWPTRASW